MIALFLRYPEVLPLVVNLAMLVVAICQREPGKSCYWLGASVLTVGLMVMKG